MNKKYIFFVLFFLIAWIGEFQARCLQISMQRLYCGEVDLHAITSEFIKIAQLCGFRVSNGHDPNVGKTLEFIKKVTPCSTCGNACTVCIFGTVFNKFEKLIIENNRDIKNYDELAKELNKIDGGVSKC